MNNRLLASARDYLDLIKAPVLVLNKNGKIEYANDALCFLLGYNKKEMMQKNWFENFIPGETKLRELREFRSLILGEKGAIVQREDYVKSKNDEVFLIEWQDTLLKDAEGNCISVLSSGQDSSEKFLLRKSLKEQKEQSRRELMQAVLEAGELERKQIAFELHDGVNQVLTVCKLLIENEMTAHPAPVMKKVTEQLQSVIDEIRSMSHRLNPGDLGNAGLYSAVKELIKQTDTAGNMHTRLKISGARYLKLIPSVTSINLYRIIQEALNNILKHAAATEVRIELFGGRQYVDLEIRDNGRGFQRKAICEGLGLKTIYSRAQAIGGQAYISSSTGQGTLLSVHIPVAG